MSEVILGKKRSSNFSLVSLILLYLVLFFEVKSLNSQTISGNVTDIIGKPLSEVTVIWKGTTIQTQTNSEGNFEIEDYMGTVRILELSRFGFRTESITVGEIKTWHIQLIEGEAIKEVTITAKAQASRFLNETAKVEVLGVREIQRAACCSLAGCFSTNSNVDANVTNVVTDAKELRILGLSGVYNQILVEGMPLIQGLSYPYGPGSYPGTMIEKIFVTKGANSVLQGFESISGQINIDFFNAETSPKWFFNVFANSFGESQYNINHTIKREGWNNFTSAHLTLPASIIDRDKDGFRDIVKTNRVSLFNRWVYDNAAKPKWRSSIGVRYLSENREGGQTGYQHSNHLGSDNVYGQNVAINHGEAYAKINYILHDKISVIMLTSAFGQHQKSYFGIKKYEGNQFNFNSSLYMDYYYGVANHNLKVGFSIRHNILKEEITFLQKLAFLNYEGIYHNDYDIPGIFAENKLTLAPFTILSGIRLDKFAHFGWKAAPRLLIRVALGADTDLRYSIGKGYRWAHIFAENSNLIASNRDLIFASDLHPEEAINTGINFVQKLHWKEMLITLSGDAYYTVFQNQIFPDYNKHPYSAFIDNFFGRSISKSFQIENKWEFSPVFDLKWSYNYLDIYRKVDGIAQQLPFVPKHKWIANTSYSTNNDRWQIDLTYKWVGSKILPETSQYPPAYQLKEKSDPFGQLDLQLTRRWSQFQLYGGIENILDFRQKFPILAYDLPFSQYFDPSFNWGPTKGREIYLGLRYSIK